MPIDVVEAVPGSRLVLRVHTAPGVAQTMAFEVTAGPARRQRRRVSVVVDGLFARPAVGPLWLSSALTPRLLVARVERLARASRRAA